jgi:hypothetical protein
MERIDRDDLYPQSDEAGETDVWDLPTAGGSLVVNARFLGVATSQQKVHSHPGEYPADDRKCARCRWFEPRIFREVESGRYILYTIGCSDIPGERDLIRFRYSRDAYEVITSMMTPHPVTGERGIVGVTQRMFDQASKYDDELRDALTEKGILPASGETWRTS